jgi:hypothetical protein
MKNVISAFAVCVFCLLLWVGYSADCASPRTITGTVQSKYVKRFGKSDRYVVEIRTESDVEIVQCRNCVWRLDWRSADKFASLREGETVTLQVAGWRLPFLSWFPRIER